MNEGRTSGMGEGPRTGVPGRRRSYQCVRVDDERLRQTRRAGNSPRNHNGHDDGNGTKGMDTEPAGATPMDNRIQLDMRGRNRETERLRKIGAARYFEENFNVPVGTKFTNWTVIETGLSHPDGGKNTAACRVRCVCGKVSIVKRRRLTSERSRSCGCFKRGLKVEDPHWKKVFASIRHNAKNRAKCCEFLTYNRFRLISQLPCAYCGSDPANTVTVAVTTYDKNGTRLGRLKGNPRTYSGIDRVDSSKGYEQGNMLPCCVTCNRAKNVQSLKDFLSYLARHGSTLKEEELLGQAELLGQEMMALR